MRSLAIFCALRIDEGVGVDAKDGLSNNVESVRKQIVILILEGLRTLTNNILLTLC